MQINLSTLISPFDKIGVAVSGGGDSVALLHYLKSKALKENFSIVAINIEHGIRGEQSINDSEFVKILCAKWKVELISYRVNALKKAEEEKLSLEESARALRYECFYNAINDGICNKIATAHHSRDNAESVLFNLFRGTGLKGVSGIEKNFNNKIIRPFISLSKEDIENYITENNLPFVTDQTNFDQDYTRNFIRLSLLPEIKKVFPEVERSILRFSEIAKLENDYLEEQTNSSILFNGKIVQIDLSIHPALLSRATIKALKLLGVEKDWEKSHVDSVLSLTTAKNGAKIDLSNGIVVAKEYNVLTFFYKPEIINYELPFSIGKFTLGENAITIEKVEKPKNLKDGLFLDLDKIPKSAVIRFKKDGDLFTKFGGGTKPLGEYLTDQKIAQRKRNFIPIIADGNKVLAIFGVAISNSVKVDDTTKNIIKIN